MVNDNEIVEVIVANPGEKVEQLVKGRRSYPVSVLLSKKLYTRDEAKKWVAGRFYRYWDVTDKYKNPKYWHFSLIPPEEEAKKKDLRSKEITKGIVMRFGFEENYSPEKRMVEVRKRTKLLKPIKKLETLDVGLNIKVTDEIRNYVLENKELSPLKLSFKVYDKFGVKLHPSTIARIIKHGQKTKQTKQKEVNEMVEKLPAPLMREAMKQVREGKMSKSEALKWAWKKYRGEVSEAIEEDIGDIAEPVEFQPVKTIAEYLANPRTHITKTAWFREKILRGIEEGKDAHQIAEEANKEVWDAIKRAGKLPLKRLEALLGKVGGTATFKFPARIITRRHVMTVAKIMKYGVTRGGKVIVKPTHPDLEIWKLIPVRKPPYGRPFSMEWLLDVSKRKPDSDSPFIKAFIEAAGGIKGLRGLTMAKIEANKDEFRRRFYEALRNIGKVYVEEKLKPFLGKVRKVSTSEGIFEPFSTKTQERMERRYAYATELLGSRTSLGRALRGKEPRRRKSRALVGVGELIDEAITEAIDEEIAAEAVGEMIDAELPAVSAYPGFSDIPILAGDIFIALWLKKVVDIILNFGGDFISKNVKVGAVSNLYNVLRPVALFVAGDLVDEQVLKRLPFTLPFGLGRYVGYSMKFLAILEFLKKIKDMIPQVKALVPVEDNVGALTGHMFSQDYFAELPAGEEHYEVIGEVDLDVDSPIEISEDVAQKLLSGDTSALLEMEEVSPQTEAFLEAEGYEIKTEEEK